MGSATAEYEVFVQINRNIADPEGNIMSANALPVRFFTSMNEDENPPAIAGEIDIKTNAGTLITIAGNPVSNTAIKVDFEAGDSESPVIYASITSDLDGTLYDDAYQRDIPVTLNGVEGTRTLTVVVSDPSGNESTPPKTVAVLYDHTIPTVSTPLLGASYYGSPLVVSGTASDTGAAPSGIHKAQYSFDGTTWADLTDTTSWSGSLALSSPEGAKTLYVRSQDKAGNYSTVGSVGFTYDNAVPALTETAINTASQVNRTDDFTVAGDANDTNAFTSVVITATKDGVSQGTLLSDTTAGAYTYTQSVNEASHAQDGLWVYTITATDVVNRTQTLTRTVRVDTTRPVLTYTGVTPSSGTLAIGTTLAFTFSSAEDDLAAGTLSVNGKTAVLSGPTGSGPYVYTVTYTVAEGDTNRVAGAIPVNISLDDTAGNPSTAYTTSPGSVGIDAARPTFTVPAVTPSSGTLAIGDTLAFTLRSSEGTLAAGTLSVNGKTAVLTGPTGSGPYDYTATYTVAEGDTERAAGAIPVSLRLADAAGNTSAEYSTSPASVGVDANPPSITASSAAAGLALIYTATGTPYKLFYWAGDTNKAGAAGTVYETTSITSPVTLSSLVADQTFGFCLSDAAGNDSPCYTFTWTPGSPGSYSAPTPRSLLGSTGTYTPTSDSTPIASLGTRSRTLPTFPTTVALTTTPGSWLEPRAKTPRTTAASTLTAPTAMAIQSTRTEAPLPKAAAAEASTAANTPAAAQQPAASTTAPAGAPKSPSAALDKDPASSAAVEASYTLPAPGSASSGTIPTEPSPAPDRSHGNGIPPVSATVPARTDGKRKESMTEEDIA